MLKKLDYRDLAGFAREELEVLETIPVGQATRKYSNQSRIAKAMFFLLREGFTTAMRKYLSRRLEQDLERSECFVIARLKGQQLWFGGFQFSSKQPILYFLRSSFRTSKPLISDYATLMRFNPFLGCPPKDSGHSNEQTSFAFRPILTQRAPGDALRNVNLFLIGGGDYVRTVVLPLLGGFFHKGVADFRYNLLGSKYFKDFEIATNDYRSLFDHRNDMARECTVIASYHSYHTQQTLDVLEHTSSKILVEKPPCVTREDLINLARAYDQGRILIGYNRRYIDWNLKIRDLIAYYGSPVIINVLVNEVKLSERHWYFAPNQGTRVIGNLCHWIDLGIFLTGKAPVSVMVSRNDLLGIDRSSFAIVFEDGSMMTIQATDLGDGTRGVTEAISIKSEELDVRISDYLHMRLWNKGRASHFCHMRRNKGHRAMYEKFKRMIQNDEIGDYSKADLVHTSLTCISIVELFNSNQDSKRLDFSSYLDSQCVEAATT